MGAAPFPSRTSSRHAISAAAGRPARFAAGLLAAGLLSGGLPGGASAQSLRGSSASLDRQVEQARRHDFTHLANAPQLRRFVDAGYLVRVAGNADYTLANVSFPFARPEVRLFIERLSAQYRRACGERLVVTSLTRPLSHQPRNASVRSVHPTGMAIDLRLPAGRCRAWLESVLLALEARGVLEATAERRPPHYHVAVYPKPYAAYVRQLTARADAGAAASAPASATPAASAPASAGPAVHVVRRGDTLSGIAGRYGASVAALRRANGLGSSLIRPGQTLRVPGAPRSASRAGVGAGTAAASAADARGPVVERSPGSVGARAAAGGLDDLRHPLDRVERSPGSVGARAAAASAAGEPASAPAAASTPSASRPVVHVVRRGDTLSGIARRYGASVAGLRRANGLGSSLIRPGQPLRVPGAPRSAARAGEGASAAAASAAGASAPSAPRPVVHVVRRGDTLSGIARRYGASVAGLRRANGLGSSLIRPGQPLRVPGAPRAVVGASAASASAAGASASRPVVHVVRRGDTLSGIARRYGASVAGLRRANGLGSSLIRPGQALRVPRSPS